MDIYLGGTPVTLTIPLNDAYGNALNVQSVQYRIVNQDSTELQAATDLAGFAPGAASAVIVVPATLNVLADLGNINQWGIWFETTESRTVELYLTLSDGNVMELSGSYGLTPADPLIEGLNSFQTFMKAQQTAMNIPNIPAFVAADDRTKITALMEARNHLCQLNYSLLNSNSNLDQTNINYVPDTRVIGRNDIFVFNGDLSLMTPQQYLTLPNKLKHLLRMAQVVEADFILGGDVVGDRRRAGLMETKAGESSQMFRPGKPLDLPVCRRALSYLGFYVTLAKRVGRSA